LSKPEVMAGKFLIYPDYHHPEIFYYVPTRLSLVKTYGQPQFFFYKYIYVKQGSTVEPQTVAGGVLALAIEFADDSEIISQLKGKMAEIRPVSIEKIKCTLNYESLEDITKVESNRAKENLAERQIIWARKGFTLSLSRYSAQFLWQIFEGDKATGLTVECEFEYKGYELDAEGKIVEGARWARISFPVPISLKQNPELFKVINLAEKFSFNYRRLTILCFDFVNKLNDKVAKIIVEVGITTARGQRDFKTVTFTADSDSQIDLEFKIPEVRRGKYLYRITRIYEDGHEERSAWIEGSDMFLDISTYGLAEVKNKND